MPTSGHAWYPHHNSGMSDIILIRHGETDWNRQQRFQGHSDIPLNDIGLEQARRLVQALAGEAIAQVISSDLIRTQQTAAPLLAARGLQLSARPIWREQAFGDLEGVCVAEMPQRYPDLWAQWLRHDPDFRLPGPAESRRQFHARALSALRAAAAEQRQRQAEPGAAAGALLVFTHGGLLDMLYREATGQGLHGPRTTEIPNTGINRLRVSGERIEILAWAEQDHLIGLPQQPSTAQAGLEPAGSVATAARS
jgi:probable phosphoglycerate mutase